MADERLDARKVLFARWLVDTNRLNEDGEVFDRPSSGVVATIIDTMPAVDKSSRAIVLYESRRSNITVAGTSPYTEDLISEAEGSVTGYAKVDAKTRGRTIGRFARNYRILAKMQSTEEPTEDLIGRFGPEGGFWMNRKVLAEIVGREERVMNLMGLGKVAQNIKERMGARKG